MKTAILLMAIALVGCAQAGPAYVRDGITFHPDDLSACKPHTAGCTVSLAGRVDVYYSTLNPATLEHEMEHAEGGLIHSEPWQMHAGNICAQVIRPGSTHWHRGAWMCRAADGSFFEVAQ